MGTEDFLGILRIAYIKSVVTYVVVCICLPEHTQWEDSFSCPKEKKSEST